jgi:hypothetical protein
MYKFLYFDGTEEDCYPILYLYELILLAENAGDIDQIQSIEGDVIWIKKSDSSLNDV